MQIGTLQHCATTEKHIIMVTWHDDLWPDGIWFPFRGYWLPHLDVALALEVAAFANLQPNTFEDIVLNLVFN